jgi:hypothetical protein
MNLFGSKAPSRQSMEEVINALSAALHMIDDASADAPLATLQERVSRGVLVLKETIVTSAEELAGLPSAEKEKEARDALGGVSDGLMRLEIMQSILTKMARVDFETRKNIAAVFCYVVKKDVHGFASAYMVRHLALMQQLISGYANSDLALPCGKMLRECLVYERLHELVLVGSDGDLSPEFKSLFETHVINPNFEVAADAFETLSAFLKFNKALVLRTFNPDEPASAEQ